MTNETWGEIRENLIKTVGKNNYVNWIEPLEFAELDSGVATFLVPTNFMGDWVSRNFGEHILHELSEAGQKVTRVRFSVPNGRPLMRKPAKMNDRAVAAPQDPDAMPGAPLDSRFTFDTFVVGKPNELAHAAARRVAEGGVVTFNPLFLYGGVGLGKTHLMHAIAWELKKRSPDLRVVYLSAEQFMYRFVQALRDKDMIAFKQLFRSVDVLMVDDVQFIAGKDATQEEFFHTFNALVDQNKQVIVSSDRAPTEIAGIEDRIVSRLQSGLVVDLHPTNYELRLGILQQKVEQYSAQFPNLEIADGVLEFLAHRISSNVRVLEGALMRLFAFGALVGPRDHDGTDPGLSGRYPSRLGPEDHRRGNPAQGVRSLQHPPVGYDRPEAGEDVRASTPDRHVSLQTTDLALSARDRSALRRAGSYDGHARRSQNRGTDAEG